MRTLSALSILLSTITLAAPAHAQDSSKCSGFIMASVQTEYPFQDLGFDASNGVDVTQDMFAVTCGKLTVDWWSSTGLSPRGKYGERGGMDEHDIELSYTDTAKIPIGTVKYTMYAAYYAIDLGRGLKSTKDDFVEVYAEVARPIPIGKWTAEPFVRYIWATPLRGSKDFSTLRVGGRLDGPITFPALGKIELHLDAAHAGNRGAAPYRSVWRGEADLGKDLGHGLGASVGIKYTQHVGYTPLARVTYSFKF